MRCLYCGKHLALFRRLTGGGEFCSDAHKQSYHVEYNRLALTRLIAAPGRSEQAGPPASNAGASSHGGNSAAKALKSRMLEAPAAEPAPPPAAKLLLRKSDAQAWGRTKPSEIPTEPRAVAAPVLKPTWVPAVAEVEPVAPPAEAGALAIHILPNSARSATHDQVAAAVSEPMAAERVPMLPNIAIRFRAITAFQPRPPIRSNPLEFAGVPVATPQLEQTFEEMPVVGVVTFNVKLDLLPRAPVSGAKAAADHADTPLPLAECPVQPIINPPDSPPSAGGIPEARRSGVEGGRNRPASIKLKLTGMPAGKPDVSTATDPAPDPANKPSPKLPTIPATRRRTSTPIPSILDPGPEQTEEPSHSLWGAIRKYIHR